MFKHMTRSWIRQALLDEERNRYNKQIDRIEGPFHDRLGQRKFSAFGVLEEAMWQSLERASILIVREEVPADETE
jgi:hypothetical protein